MNLIIIFHVSSSPSSSCLSFEWVVLQVFFICCCCCYLKFLFPSCVCCCSSYRQAALHPLRRRRTDWINCVAVLLHRILLHFCFIPFYAFFYLIIINIKFNTKCMPSFKKTHYNTASTWNRWRSRREDGI